MTTMSSGFGTPAALAPLRPESVVPLTAIYPIARVDLMPPEILAQRRFRRARGLMVTALVVTVGAAGAAFVLSLRSADVAAEALAAEQATTASLTAEASTYDEVPRVQASIERARTALESSLDPDIAWYPYLYQLSVSAPEAVWFDKITFTVLPPETPVTDPLAPAGAVATVSTTGHALSYPDVAAWVDEMDAVTTWGHALLADAAAEPKSGVVTFTATARLGADARSGRYRQAAPTTAPAPAPADTGSSE